MIAFGPLNTAVTGAFAEPVTIFTSSGTIETRGIFDSRHFEVQGFEGEVGISELVTTVAVDLTETGPVAAGDTVVARETTYRVADLRTGRGWSCSTWGLVTATRLVWSRRLA